MEQEMNEEELIADDLMEDETPVEEEVIETDYFAVEEADALGPLLVERVNDYYDHLQGTGKLALWRRVFEKYYRGVWHDGQILEAGEQGEYSLLYVNQFRNFIQNLLTLTTSTPPWFEPQSTNTDYTSQAITILSKGLLDYYMKEKKMDRNLNKGAESAILYGEGFGVMEWDVFSGEDYITDESGKPVKEGDIKYSYYTPIDIIRDYNARKSSDTKWWIKRDFINKYDLMARYPEKEDDICSVSWNPKNNTLDPSQYRRTTNYKSDIIPVYTFFHERIEPLMPEGRFTVFLDSGTVLYDGALPYSNVPIFRAATGDIDEQIFGYSISFDLLPLQEMIDTLASSIATNQRNHGVLDILEPEGMNLKLTNLAPGMNKLTYNSLGNGLKPEIFEKLKTPNELKEFLRECINFMQEISGINSAVRGNPPPGLTAGVSLALLSSNALQYSQRLQDSFRQFCEDHGTGTIKMLQDFAETDRVVSIIGKYDAVLAKTFKKDDLDSIARVTVSIGNPLMKTTAGRMDMAANYLKNGWIQSPDQMTTLLETGRYEPLFESKRMENLTIRMENERLLENHPNGVVAILTDNHLQHIFEHRGLLANPSARDSPEITNATLNHIQEHLDILTNPKLTMLLNALGQRSMAPMMPPPQPPPPQGANDPSAQPSAALTPPTTSPPGVRSLNTLTDPQTGMPLDIQPQA
jgi:hypothetical protein